MTDTEKLLLEATDIARGAFEDPSEEAVLTVFRRLCLELDTEPDCIEPVQRTLH